ncbi:MAG: hypothetical protein HGA87_02540 [Desulfobulbaceae bacterium]|nr:hypothetical protein [Desulfobulbaceae bacterium]
MTNYNFAECLSPIDFELLSKDILEAELGIRFENFSEGRDQGIDLRHAPAKLNGQSGLKLQKSTGIIVQCKRYSKFADLKSELKNKELCKIIKLNPGRYILTTSVSLSPMQVDELKQLMYPFVRSSGDIYGRERLNSILANHKEIERRHIKLWVSSVGVLDSIIHAGTHVVSREELARTIAAAKLYVKNPSFDDALRILKSHRVCIISGLPGIGKTTLARMLMLYFMDVGYELIKIESDISEARAVDYGEKPYYYYYDDFLGQTAHADKLNKNEDQKLLDFMASVRESKSSVFVLTTREYILNQAKIYYEKFDRERFDYQTCIIDLTKYSRRIRAQILYNHLYFSVLPKPYVRELVSCHGYRKIIDHKNYNPRLIEYLTSIKWLDGIPSSRYYEYFILKLDNPIDVWGHAFRNQISERARHLLVIMTLMPVLSLIADVEMAFDSFHRKMTLMYGLSSHSSDYKFALKELDGTFIMIQKSQDAVLIGFQNPSIRDFMQNLLLGGEMLQEVVGSLVYFEQARWLFEILDDDDIRIEKQYIRGYLSEIVESIKLLITADSCLVDVIGNKEWSRVEVREVNLLERIAFVVGIGASMAINFEAEWVEEQLQAVCDTWEIDKKTLSSILRSIKILSDNSCLQGSAGKKIISNIKSKLLEDLDDLDDFEYSVKIANMFPKYYEEAELETIGAKFLEYIEIYMEDYSQLTPDEMREDAEKMRRIGTFLNVDTDLQQSELIEEADREEEDQQMKWEYDDNNSKSLSVEECTDKDLDSMFETLIC